MSPPSDSPQLANRRCANGGHADDVLRRRRSLLECSRDCWLFGWFHAKPHKRDSAITEPCTHPWSCRTGKRWRPPPRGSRPESAPPPPSRPPSGVINFPISVGHPDVYLGVYELSPKGRTTLAWAVRYRHEPRDHCMPFTGDGPPPTYTSCDIAAIVDATSGQLLATVQ